MNEVYLFYAFLLSVFDLFVPLVRIEVSKAKSSWITQNFKASQYRRDDPRDFRARKSPED